MKKSIVFILSIFFISTFVNAQITVMPYLQGGMSSIREQPKQLEPLEFTDYFELAYKPVLGYATGLLLNYQFNERIEVQTGIEYQNTGIKQEIMLLDNNPASLRSYSYSYSYSYGGIDTVDRTQAEISSNYINIPIQVQYNFRTRKKIIPYIALGANLSWFMKGHSSVEGYFENELVGEINETFDNIDNIFFAGLNLDFGIRRQINKKLSFNAFISGDMYLSEFGEDNVAGLYYKPFNISLGVGLAYSIDYK